MGAFRLYCAEIDGVLLLLGGHKDKQSKDIKSSLYALIKRFGGTSISESTGIPRTTFMICAKTTAIPLWKIFALSLIFLNIKKPHNNFYNSL